MTTNAAVPLARAMPAGALAATLARELGEA